MVELTFEDELNLLSDELGRIFSSNFLDEPAPCRFKQAYPELIKKMEAE
jgi:hypothetical protein